MRTQLIKHTRTQAYVTYYGKRLLLENFERCYTTYTDKGKEIKFNGVMPVGAFGCYLIAVSEDGETAKVTYKQY